MTTEGGTTVVIFAGGDPVPGDVIEDLPGPALVIAADSGLELALDLGLKVDLVIGDLDSVSPQDLAAMPGRLSSATRKTRTQPTSNSP